MGASIRKADRLKADRLAFARRFPYCQPMNERIEINPRVCGGQPVVKGTRIPVVALLEQLTAGESWDSLLHAYPELARADIQAALDYARQAVLHTEFTVLEPA